MEREKEEGQKGGRGGKLEQGRRLAKAGPVSRGVARNLFRMGSKLVGGLGDGRPSAGSSGRAPMGVWGVAPKAAKC